MVLKQNVNLARNINILKDKKMEKNIIFGNYEKDKNLYYLSLEEIGIKESFNSFLEMYSFIKNSKMRYRVSLDDIDSSRVFRKLFIKSYTEFYNFYKFYMKFISYNQILRKINGNT